VSCNIKYNLYIKSTVYLYTLFQLALNLSIEQIESDFKIFVKQPRSDFYQISPENRHEILQSWSWTVSMRQNGKFQAIFVNHQY